MPIDLLNWVPSKILETSQDPAGFIVDDEEWNRRWNLNRAQGDDTAQALYEAIQALYTTAWHPTAGAASIKNPALSETSGTDVAAQLTWAAAWLATLQGIIDDPDTGLAARRLISTAITHDEITDRDAADSHPITAITGLEERLTSIQAGALDAVAHNLLPSRDVADAHPMAAITGLAAFKSAYDTLAAAYAIHNHNSNVLVHGTGTIAQKFASIDATIASITGDIGEITHNDLAGRDAAGAHPIGAITGLQTALDAKLAAATAATTYQPKILDGTDVPAAALGNNGDVYIRLAAS